MFEFENVPIGTIVTKKMLKNIFNLHTFYVSTAPIEQMDKVWREICFWKKIARKNKENKSYFQLIAFILCVGPIDILFLIRIKYLLLFNGD